jgi:hypothetical protein
MRKFLVISISLLAVIVLSSKSCSSPAEEEAAAREEAVFHAKIDSINRTLESDFPGETALREFESRAQQKLADLADYLQICFDKSVDRSFQEQTSKLISDLFISDTVIVCFKVWNENKEKCSALRDFLNSEAAQEKNSGGFVFDSIRLSEPLSRGKDGCYYGSLAFSQVYKWISETGSGTGYERKTAAIIAWKINKPFGKDTLRVWSVFLGAIR